VVFSTAEPVYTETDGETVGDFPVEPYPSDSSVEGGDDLEGGTLDDATDAITPEARVAPRDGMLFVSLPKNAKLFVNGQPTTSAGATRRFVSNGLKTGFRYPFNVKAVVEEDGQSRELTKTVNLRAGETARLAFDFDQKVNTKLTVRVPADAKLVLAGSVTKSKGDERNFTTKRLTDGEVWEGYKVVATVNRDGRDITKAQTIDLKGGEARTLTFDFDQDQVASR
jgi:uncharacterized protein (TIGR03000 family)